MGWGSSDSLRGKFKELILEELEKMFLANHIDYLAGTRLGIHFHQDICWVVTKSLPEVNWSHPSSNQWINEEHRQKLGLPWWLRGSRICLQCRRYRFDPWVKKIPWTRKRQPTPVFLPRESPWAEEPGRLQSMGSQLDMTERLSTYTWPKVVVHRFLFKR